MFSIDRNETELIAAFEAGLKALREYRPMPSPVPITLFRAGVPLMSHLAMDPTLGWKDLAKGEVQVRIVPGDHHSMTTEPLVRDLAKALSDELDVVQNSRSVSSL
jgi:thioesterase domain-containing protein